MHIRTAVLAVVCLMLNGCVKISNPYQMVPPGIWRATLDLADNPGTDQGFDEKSSGKLPFNFEVIYDSQDIFHLEVINGQERIRLDEIAFGRDIRTGRDTIQIEFPAFDTYIRAEYEEDAIEGTWYDRSRGDYSIPFRAYHGKTERFDLGVAKPGFDASGRWKVMFGVETEEPYPAIGVFNQDGPILTGTFLTETGDYRYLQGNVGEDRLYLSAFDGSHVFLFEAKLQADGTLSGIFRSGSHYKTYWVGERNDTFSLAGPEALTTIDDPTEPFNFEFKAPDGHLVSLDKAPYAGRPKIVVITGTWCPNCRDLTAFIRDYKKANPGFDIPIVALAFERHRSEADALAAIKAYKEYFDITYDMVYAGPSGKSAASEILPQLNRVVAYPTLIFMDAENRVIETHTGFSGPATDGYDDFKVKFQRLVDRMRAL